MERRARQDLRCAVKLGLFGLWMSTFSAAHWWPGMDFQIGVLNGIAIALWSTLPWTLPALTSEPTR